MTQKTTASDDMQQLKSVIEAALMASEAPLSIRKIRNLFDENIRPETAEVNQALDAIGKDCERRGIELRQIGKGYRFQTKDQYASWLRKLRDTRPPRYSRALIETLSIVAYRQPVTRGDIEGIRGVAVSSDIMRTLLDREWISQVGHRDVPGRPALYATTDGFLEYFNLRSLSELPALIEPRDIEDVAKELNITLPLVPPVFVAGKDVMTAGEEADDEPDDDDEVQAAGANDASDAPEDISDVAVSGIQVAPALTVVEDEDDDVQAAGENDAAEGISDAGVSGVEVTPGLIAVKDVDDDDEDDVQAAGANDAPAIISVADVSDVEVTPDLIVDHDVNDEDYVDDSIDDAGATPVVDLVQGTPVARTPLGEIRVIDGADESSPERNVTPVDFSDLDELPPADMPPESQPESVAETEDEPDPDSTR